MIYLDNAASTRPDAAVLQAMSQAAEMCFANPASAHALGAAASRALETARAEVAALLAAEPSEIIFTSGGTEADALAVLGTAAITRARRVVTTSIEHPAILRNAELLVARGFEHVQVAPGPDGVVPAAALADAVDDNTALVAVMLVNNELGTVQPVAQAARAVRAKNPRCFIHVDAVQAAGLMPVDVRELGVDGLALSGHKMHGPRGAGALWLRKGARVGPLWDGGRQENGLRSGTENLPALVGLGHAAALARAARADIAAMVKLRDDLEREVVATCSDLVPGLRPTVTSATRAPHITSLLFPDLPAEPLLHALEAETVYVSAGSACASRTRGPSHVLRAIGVSDRDAVLRFSLCRSTTRGEISAAVRAVRVAVTAVMPRGRKRAS